MLPWDPFLSLNMNRVKEKNQELLEDRGVNASEAEQAIL